MGRSLLIIFSATLVNISLANAISIDPKVENEYLKLGGSEKALTHVKCFLANYYDQDFNLRKASLSERCNNMANDQMTVNLNSHEHLVIVDHSQKSFYRRFYLLDLKNPKEPFVETYYAAHGRYKATHDNTDKKLNHNTIEEIIYWSNVKNSNASSSGFYITGHMYMGRLNGPKDDKYSLIIHGINKDLNDNACDRAIVLHGSLNVKESGDDEGVKAMSSGCIMVDYDYVNEIIAIIRGGGGDHFKGEDRLGGTLFFSYGNNEALLPSNYYCTPDSQGSLRL